LREFLEVMQPPSRSKTWMSEGIAGTMDRSVSGDLAVQITEGDGIRDSRGEHQAYSASQHTGETVHELVDKPSVPDEHKSMMEDVAHTTETAESFVEQYTTSISDADWLRSRTSRLLDLQDDVGDSEHSKTPAASSDPNSHPGIGEARRGNSSREVQADSDPGEESTERDGKDALMEAVTASRRLFVRNLSYGATEDDLRGRFSQFGNLEEV
jgi:multiple RNA-binding domain-containing protein 1